MGKLIDLTKMIFGRWTVLEKDLNNKDKKNVYWICQCGCTNKTIKYIDGTALRKGSSKSCGCLQKELVKKRFSKKNKYDLSGEFGIGYTEENEIFYFDLEDYELIKNYYWSYSEYILCSRKKIRMHRLVLNYNEKEYLIDHINRIKWDNRKSNLRIATNSQNVINSNIKITNTSGIIGVTKIPNGWRVRINHKGKRIHISVNENFRDAIISRLQAEKEYYGEFAPQKHLFKQYGIEE